MPIQYILHFNIIANSSHTENWLLHNRKLIIGKAFLYVALSLWKYVLLVQSYHIWITKKNPIPAKMKELVQK